MHTQTKWARYQLKGQQEETSVSNQQPDCTHFIVACIIFFRAANCNKGLRHLHFSLYTLPYNAFLYKS